MERRGKIHFAVRDSHRGVVGQERSLRLPRGKQYLSDEAEVEVGTIWDDLPTRLPLGERGSEKISGQKPLGLLERIVAIGSDPSDLVLDPFMGSGTSLIAAQRSGRRWLGGDISEAAYRLTINRLSRSLDLRPGEDFLMGDQDFLAAHWGIVSNTYAPVLTGLEKPGLHLRTVAVAPARFTLNEEVQIEENLHFEFKEVRGGNPIATIRQTVDEYAVAFLNSEGGHIF